MTSYKSVQIVQLESIEILPSGSDSHQDHTQDVYNNGQPQHFQFKCTLCPLQYNDKQEFQSHVRDHFKPITCNDCNKTFIGDKQYTYHRKHFHVGTKTLDELNVIEGVIENLPMVTASTTTTTTKTTTEIQIKNECFDENSFDSVESSVVATSVACDVCGRLFPDSAAVMRHRRTHSNEGKRFFCNVCNSGFNKKTNLEFHLRIHTNERPFTCDQCPKSFAHVSGLNCHRRVHTGERPYKCPFCTKSYAHSTDLRRHRRTHGLEEKRFSCALCTKQFFENKFLKSHMRTHHRDGSCSAAGKSGKKTISSTLIEIRKFDECIDEEEEYIDYEYIHSD